MRPTFSSVLLLAVVAMGLAAPGAAIAPAARPADTGANTATLSITSTGLLAVNFTFTDPNGSALRYAMDGNFTPLVDTLPVNASTRASALSQIAALESAPLVGGFFGNRDGTVSPGEVTLFEGLLHQLTTTVGSSVPSGTLSVTALASLTLDGARPTTPAFQSVSFTGAEGLDTSAAPIGISLEFSYQFPISGSEHTLAFTVGSGGLPSALTVPTGIATVSFATPAGTTITSADGLSSVSIVADAWGWGPSSATGQYQLATNSTIAFHYRTSFPTGDLVIGAVTTGAVAVAASILLLRRRRRRRAAPVPAPAAGEAPVGPSGSA